MFVSLKKMRNSLPFQEDYVSLRKLFMINLRKFFCSLCTGSLCLTLLVIVLHFIGARTFPVVNYALGYRRQRYTQSRKEGLPCKVGPRTKSLGKKIQQKQRALAKDPPLSVFIKECYVPCFTQFHCLLPCLLTEWLWESDTEAGVSQLRYGVSQP